MPGLVSDATRIWELNIYWALHSQCGIWDPKGKGVDIWECIRPRAYCDPPSIVFSSDAIFLQIIQRQAHKYVPAALSSVAYVSSCLFAHSHQIARTGAISLADSHTGAPGVGLQVIHVPLVKQLDPLSLDALLCLPRQSSTHALVAPPTSLATPIHNS